jgi:hypothetical protein
MVGGVGNFAKPNEKSRIAYRTAAASGDPTPAADSEKLLIDAPEFTMSMVWVQRAP